MYEYERDDDFYELDFVFGPSGVFFHPALELTISGDYIEDVDDIALYDDEGFPVEVNKYCYEDDDNDIEDIVFFIDHFSEYYFNRR